MIPERRGLARSTDPSTSHLATHHSSPTGHALRWLILGLLHEHPEGLYDDELVVQLDEVLGDGNFTHSGAKTRRKELVDLGLVEQIATTVNVRRRRVCVWNLTEEGRHVLAAGDPRVVARLFREFRRRRDREQSEAGVSPSEYQHVLLRWVLGEVVAAYDSLDGDRLARAIGSARSCVG